MAMLALSADEQPREKLLQNGPGSLSDAELLAIFLRTGVNGCNAVDLARQLLQDFGSLKALFSATQQEFCQVKGLGPVKYCQLKAVLEMANRYLWEELKPKLMLTSADSARDFLYSKMYGLNQEVFSCIFLDNQHQVISYQALFYGTLNQAAVYPREIARKGLENNAAAVILAHNHPSGLHEPSQADKVMTQQIIKALKLLDIKVLDHFIIGNAAIFSFAESGLL